LAEFVAGCFLLLQVQPHLETQYWFNSELPSYWSRKLRKPGADILCGRPPDLWPFEL